AGARGAALRPRILPRDPREIGLRGHTTTTRLTHGEWVPTSSTTRLGPKLASREDSAGPAAPPRKAPTPPPISSRTRPSVKRSPRSKPIVNPPSAVVGLLMPASLGPTSVVSPHRLADLHGTAFSRLAFSSHLVRPHACKLGPLPRAEATSPRRQPREKRDAYNAGHTPSAASSPHKVTRGPRPFATIPSAVPACSSPSFAWAPCPSVAPTPSGGRSVTCSRPTQSASWARRLTPASTSSTPPMCTPGACRSRSPARRG